MANGTEWSIGIMYGVVILAILGVFIWLLVSKTGKKETFDAGYPTYPFKQYKAPTTLLS